MKKLKLSKILAWTAAFIICMNVIAQTNASPVSSREMEAWDSDEGEILVVSVSEDENSENGQIGIYSSQGNTKMKMAVTISDGFAEVDISKLPGGFYIIVLECNGNLYRTTVIVNK